MDIQTQEQAKQLCLRTFELWRASEQPPERFPDYWNQAVAETTGSKTGTTASAESNKEPSGDPPNRHGVVTTG